jgi:hypothetical protein
MLRKLYETFHGVHDVIVSNTLTRFRIDMGTLPSRADTDSTVSYRAPLCRDFGCTFQALMARSYTAEGDREEVGEGGSVAGNVNEIEDVVIGEVNGTVRGGEDLVASASSSSYIRSSSSDSMPELVRGRPHGRHCADVATTSGAHWTGHVVSDDPSR